MLRMLQRLLTSSVTLLAAARAKEHAVGDEASLLQVGAHAQQQSSLGTEAEASFKVTLSSGAFVQGVYEEGIKQYRGIRYATARRFALPEIYVPPANTTIEAKESPPMCIQKAHHSIVGEEDCHFLNVFTPLMPKNADPKAVLFWIHGGSFVEGEGAKDKLTLLVSDGDLVGVSPNYRLSVFGFFATEDKSVPNNLGLHDMIAALRWVQNNIRSFGGDPGQVTVAGQSAGGRAAMMLYQSPLAKSLFHRTIAESPGLLPSMGIRPSDTTAASFWQRCFVAAGCDDLQCLREKNATELAEACHVMAKGFTAVKGSHFMGYDGDILPDPVTAPFCEKAPAESSDKPLLIGGLINEWRLFSLEHPSEDFLDAFLSEFLVGYDQSPQLVKACAEMKLRKNYANATCNATTCREPHHVLGDPSLIQLATDIYSLGVQLGFGPGTGTRYRYLMDVEGADGTFGSSHGSDKCYLFCGLPWAYSHYCGSGKMVEEKRTSKMMRDYWASFVKTGVPTSPETYSPVWEPANQATSLPLLHISLDHGTEMMAKMDGAEFYSERSVSALKDIMCGRVELHSLPGHGPFSRCELEKQVTI